MPRYADTLLADGEQIAMRARQHWLATIIDARYPWLIFLGSLVLLVLSQNVDNQGLRDVLGIVVLAGIVVSVAWLIKVYWAWWAQDYIITNRRVLKVEGIINKRSADSSLEKINDAVLEQSVLGRMLDFGDLDILTANEQSVDRYRMLARPKAFKLAMLDEKHKLEQDVFQIPAPPLRAAPAAEPALASAGVGGGSASPPVEAPAPSPRQMSSEEITSALGDLADLRDRGAISPEEYEAKKQDLLGRL
jgi:hypothetical protein